MTVATSAGSTPENTCATSLVTAEKSSAGGDTLRNERRQPAKRSLFALAAASLRDGVPTPYITRSSGTGVTVHSINL
jgi:hypothetical protein